MNAREEALKITMSVLFDGCFLNDALKKVSVNEHTAFVTRLSKMTVERSITLDFAIEKASNIKLDKLDRLILGILRISVCQLLYFDIRPAAVCDEAVKLSSKVNHGAYTGYVNAVLRNISERAGQNKNYIAELTRSLPAEKRMSINYSMPQWIVSLFIKEYDEKTAARIFKQFLAEKPLCVRFSEKNYRLYKEKASEKEYEPGEVKTSKKEYVPGELKAYEKEYVPGELKAYEKEYVSGEGKNSEKDGALENELIEEYILELKEKGIFARKGNYAPCALYLEGYSSVTEIPGFDEGVFIVQDESSQVAVYTAAKVFESMQVNAAGKASENEGKAVNALDMCACPGGKTVYLAELLEKMVKEGKASRNKVKISARDLYEEKLAVLKENCSRMKVDCVQAKKQDGTVYVPSDEGAYDIIIADLPCSGLGVIGKKPDIKLRVKEDDIRELSLLQRKILDNAVRYLKKGGVLIYSTCTLTSLEDERNAEYISNSLKLNKTDLRTVLPEYLKDARGAEDGHIRLDPDKNRTDGFFISAFIKP
jgi:16S rRNA (cytosine967-C5)-methyltransferase